MELFKRGPALGFRLLVLVLLSIAIIVLDNRQQHLAYVRTGLSLVTTPVRYAVDLPFRVADWVSDNISTNRTLVEENTKLKTERLQLRAQVQKFIALERENNRLRSLLQSAHRLREKAVVARLLAIDANPYVQQFTIAKGSKDGVFLGQVVLDDTGVIGQIIRVEPMTSQVLLLTDSRSAVPVEVSRTGLRGMVVGTGHANRLSLADIPKTQAIQSGDLLVTSGLAGRFPPGYPVGTVRSVIHNPSEHFATIDINPSAHFNRSRFVLLVWPDKQA